MIFLITVTAPPNTRTAKDAIQFCKVLINRGHEIRQIFFAAEGVQNSARQSRSNLCSSWHSFLEANSLDAVCCSSAALNYALVDPSRRYKSFQLGGLTQLLTQTLGIDRHITFGIRATGEEE